MEKIMKVSTQPAVPTIHTILMKRITPKMFCTQGKKTPSNVPSFWNDGIKYNKLHSFKNYII